MQYTPQGGLYVYFRYDNQQTVMVVSNTGRYNILPDWSYFTERVGGFTKVKNAVTGEIKPLTDVEVQPKESFVFELIK